MKKSFVLHLDSLEVLDDLSIDNVAELFFAIRDFHKGGEKKLSPIIKIAFHSFRKQFDRDAEKYNKIIDRNKANGRKGGRPKKKPRITQNNPVGFSETQANPNNPVGLKDEINKKITQINPNNPDGFSETQHNPKKPDSDSVSDNVSESVSETKKENKKEKLFLLFWEKYPDTNNQSKKKTKEKYFRIIGHHAKIMDGLEKQIIIYSQNKKLKLKNPKLFLPPWRYAITWLNQECWENEVEVLKEDDPDIAQKIIDKTAGFKERERCEPSDEQVEKWREYFLKIKNN